VKREKRLTKRERKALKPEKAVKPHDGQHIHCISCGRHLDRAEFDAPATATMLRCQHGSTFPSCTSCVEDSKARLATHDRTGQAVQTAGAWH
jgi:hypothetical protein